MIECGSLSDFIEFIWKQKQGDLEWDFYLHKEHSDMSFDEFRQNLKETAQSQAVTQETIETAIKDSFSLLTDFIPE